MSNLRDTIAVLDGLAGNFLNPSGSGGANAQGGSDWFPGAPLYPSSEGLAGGYLVDRAKLNPSGSGGANAQGGSDWFPGAPLYPSSEGLAGGPECVARNPATGQCSAFRSGFAGVNPADPYAEYMQNDPYSANEPGDSYDAYLAAFKLSAYDVQRMNPSASGGANNSGGSNWFPGAPTLPSSEGLALGVVTDWPAYLTRGMPCGINYDKFRRMLGERLQALRSHTTPEGYAQIASMPGTLFWDYYRSHCLQPVVAVRRRAAILGALAAGATPAQAVELAKSAQHRYNASDAPGQAYQTAYAAVRAMGYDHAWADQAARRVASRANAALWQDLATKA